MPKLRVEYSKSGRAKCSLTSCGKKIEKNEMRIGIEVVLPFNDEGVESWKWRHLCCFTQRQLDNARASGDINDIQGEDDLAPADKKLVERMRGGELIGDTSIIGRVGDIEHSPIAALLTKKGGTAAKPRGKKEKVEDDDSEDDSKKTKGASPATGEKRPRAPRKTSAAAAAAKKKDDDVDSEATDDYEVAVENVSGKPKCPYGTNCFRTNPEHYQQYAHGGDDGGDAAARGSKPTLKPVIKKKK